MMFHYGEVFVAAGLIDSLASILNSDRNNAGIPKKIDSEHIVCNIE